LLILEAMPINADIIKATQYAIQQLYGINNFEVHVQPTRKEFSGTHTILIFPLTKISKKLPEVTANEIGNWIKKNDDIVEDFHVIKGFLNLTLKNKYWIKIFDSNFKKKTFNFPANQTKIMVEFSSPNTNKPLHLGHMRNSFLGYAVSKILEAMGYEVIKANLINDRGIHICKSMLAYLLFGKGVTPQTLGMKGDHFVGKYYVEFERALKDKAHELKKLNWSEEEIEKNNPLLLQAQDLLRKWENNDPETIDLWKKMNNWVYEGFEETYRRMGISFDKYYYESDTYLLGKQIVNEGLEKGIFYKKNDGSVWVDLSDVRLEQKLLLRADGTSVYITQDLGTAEKKFNDFGIQKSIYVVGDEQDSHFIVLKYILKKLGKPYADGIYHLSYGMVDLPTGKMKSREGTVVDADDLMNEVVEECAKYTREHGKIEELTENEAHQLFEMLGIGAIKYFLLKVDPKKRILFNPLESIDLHGHTAPYIQYTHARIKSILRKSDWEPNNWVLNNEINLTEIEKIIISLIDEYPEKLEKSAQMLDPSILANYVYELSKNYNTFYNNLSVLKEENSQVRNFRIALSQLTARVIQHSMGLLGIDVPEKM
jgi:arginyl-tRNA synthetase